MKNKPTQKRNTKATGGTIQQVLPICFAILFLLTSRLSIARYKISYVIALTMLTAGNKEPHRLFCLCTNTKSNVQQIRQIRDNHRFFLTKIQVRDSEDRHRKKPSGGVLFFQGLQHYQCVRINMFSFHCHNLRFCSLLSKHPDTPPTRDSLRESHFDSLRSPQTAFLWEGCHWTAFT